MAMKHGRVSTPNICTIFPQVFWKLIIYSKAAHLNIKESQKNPGLDFCQINPTNFPLGLFGEHLRTQSKILHEKYSAAVLIVRGFNFQPYSARDKLAIHAGISSWIGSERAVQNGDLSKDKNVAGMESEPILR